MNEDEYNKIKEELKDLKKTLFELRFKICTSKDNNEKGLLDEECNKIKRKISKCVLSLEEYEFIEKRRK